MKEGNCIFQVPNNIAGESFIKTLKQHLKSDYSIQVYGRKPMRKLMERDGVPGWRMGTPKKYCEELAIYIKAKDDIRGVTKYIGKTVNKDLAEALCNQYSMLNSMGEVAKMYCNMTQRKMVYDFQSVK